MGCSVGLEKGVCGLLGLVRKRCFVGCSVWLEKRVLWAAGTDYYRLNDYGIDEGYPRSLADDWDLTGPVDCALHWDNGYTFIFKVSITIHTGKGGGGHLHL